MEVVVSALARHRTRRTRCARAGRRRGAPSPFVPAVALALLLPLAVVSCSSAIKECSAEEPSSSSSSSGARAHHRRFPDLYTYEIVAEYPHDPAAFTQGLEYGVLCDDESNGNFTIREWYEPDDAPPSTASPAPSLAPQSKGRCREVLWESTGLYGQSQVRVVDLLTGVPIASASLDRAWFGEGLARVGDELLQLTWQGPRGFRWGARPRAGKGGAIEPAGGGGGGAAAARTGLRVPAIGTFETPLQDGWGAAVDRTDYGSGGGARDAKEGAAAAAAARAAEQRPPLVVLSDGSDRLTWVHPGNLSAVRHVDVRAPSSPSSFSGGSAGRPVLHLNELEVVDGRVWANVWMTECIAAIDGFTGEVSAWVLLHGLRRSLEGRRDVRGTAQMDVLNGIAWDRRRRRLFVTGKLWPRLFEVRVVPLSPSQRADAARYLLPTCFSGGDG